MAELTWRTSESTLKPLEIDSTSSPNGVYVRKFITEVPSEEGTKYQYQEAFLSPSEYQQYQLLNMINENVLGKENTDEYLLYQNKLNTPVLYETNGHYYKPKWAVEIYEELVTKGEKFPTLFPLSIWDATGKQENAEQMSLEDLKALTIFLGTLQEQYFYEYKVSKSK